MANTRSSAVPPGMARVYRQQRGLFVGLKCNANLRATYFFAGTDSPSPTRWILVATCSINGRTCCHLRLVRPGESGTDEHVYLSRGFRVGYGGVENLGARLIANR